MAVVTAHMPSTLGFIQRHPRLFGEVIDPATLTHHFTLREGAPVTQLLAAPADFIEGSAEPWICDIVCALLVASAQTVVLETGTFMGVTAARLCQTLNAHQGGTFLGCELEADRAAASQARLEGLTLPDVRWTIFNQDVMEFIRQQPPESIGFAWVDDDHGQEHVAQETNLLLTRMKPGGLICFHDVWGSCDLQRIVKHFGGIALDLPRLGAAGGLGLLQV